MLLCRQVLSSEKLKFSAFPVIIFNLVGSKCSLKQSKFFLFSFLSFYSRYLSVQTCLFLTGLSPHTFICLLFIGLFLILFFFLQILGLKNTPPTHSPQNVFKEISSFLIFLQDPYKWVLFLRFWIDISLPWQLEIFQGSYHASEIQPVQTHKSVLLRCIWRTETLLLQTSVIIWPSELPWNMDEYKPFRNKYSGW